MVWLMDRLLKLENLDLYLTPYKVLATGQDEGMLEFIPSRSLAQVPSTSKTVHFSLQIFSLLKNPQQEIRKLFQPYSENFLSSQYWARFDAHNLEESGFF